MVSVPAGSVACSDPGSVDGDEEKDLYWHDADESSYLGDGDDDDDNGDDDDDAADDDTDDGTPVFESFEEWMSYAQEAVCAAMDECGMLEKFGITLLECLEVEDLVFPLECDDFNGEAAAACLGTIENTDCDTIMSGGWDPVCDEMCSNDW